MQMEFDVIVVGAGHAGCEAAAAAANMGSRVLLITMNLMNMAQMSCNPSIGGIAKGQIVREIDALGGLTGIITDNTTIQFRMLNKSKGPAMWSPRAQNDRLLFSNEWRMALERIEKVHFWQDSVVEILIRQGRAVGVSTGLGMKFSSRSVILANGTFLNGTIHIGEKQFSGGRLGEKSSVFLTENLKRKGFLSSRMKTGTPARVDGRSLNFSRMEEQKGDVNPEKFSYSDTPKVRNQRSCYLTYTSHVVHEILKTGFDRSPMFTGRIKGRGPRYCPSIEDKIDRFSSKDRHQLFIEPEGWNTVEYYINGFSSSLPEEIQFKALRKVKGFEKARFFRPGYAIEYDYFPPDQLSLTLETKAVENLFFAGQINGTTGYEEAAAQGLMAGINAHLKINDQKQFILKRSEAYIGVLIDDLVTKGTEEPYRMFTSRAEYRILLRQDNADERLTSRSFEIGLATKERFTDVKEKYSCIDEIVRRMKSGKIDPQEANIILNNKGTSPILQRQKFSSLLQRPQLSINDLLSGSSTFQKIIEEIGDPPAEWLEECEIKLKYESYIVKEQEAADKLARLEEMTLDPEFDYSKITSLSMEAREKLSKIKPISLGQASRISGVSPADISVLIVYHGR
ncbi:MAG: tRNA uridine-5-carboxymethylaminomethyl(34) synthesis enzyme MnmG [bacterium]